MYSSELLHKITKNNNCFRRSNIKTVFNSDASSGKNSFRLRDCSFLNRNRVALSKCDGSNGCQVTVTKVCVKRNSTKKQRGSVCQSLCQKTVSCCQVRTGKKTLGQVTNRYKSIKNAINKCCKKN